MRAIHGQMSDNKPINRTPQERVRLLRELEQTLASMKPQVSQSLRRSVEDRIQELRRQVRQDETAAQERAASSTPRDKEAGPEGRRRPVSAAEEDRRARRSPRAIHAF